MAQLEKDLKYFWSRKLFALGLPAMMLLSYITLILHPTVGIDDTAFKVYFIDGVSPNTGRWCIYLLNKLFPLNYNPYFVELLGLLMFCLSVSLWCVVFYRLFGERIPVAAYTVFGGAMISAPIISELVVWYLQNGMYAAYGVTALAVLATLETLKQPDAGEASEKKTFLEVICCKKRIIAGILAGALLLTVAMGFYESFMIVFMVGILLAFLAVRVLDTGYCRKAGIWLCVVGGVAVLAMLLRSIAVKSVVSVFKLQDQAEVLDTRNLSDIFGMMFGWFGSAEEQERLIGIVKEYFVKYFCNGIVYLPVLLLVFAVGLLGLWAIWKTVQKKDIWILLAVLGVIVLPLVLSVAEGVATHYRSAQYVPLLTAFCVLVVTLEGQNLRAKAGLCRRLIPLIGYFLAFLLLYQQAYEMNKWLYVDAMKYEDSKRTMDAVALELSENCDISKPVCIIGNYETPYTLIEQAYCPSWSRRYALVKGMVGLVGEEVFEKYDTPYGYAAAETPLLSVINWGATAFYGFDRELINFWKMHGYSFVEDGNLSHYEEARKLMQDGPVWPEAGSVVEMEDYIIVNFGND